MTYHMTKKNWLQFATIVVFTLAALGVNLFSSTTPILIVGAVVVAVCAICGAATVCSIVWSHKGLLGKSTGPISVAFFVLFAAGAIMNYPQELDASVMELAAIHGKSEMKRQAVIATVAQRALRLPAFEQRLEAARSVYLLTGAPIYYRDERDEVRLFEPEEKSRASVELRSSLESRIGIAVEDHLRAGLPRLKVKFLGVFTFIFFASVAMLLCAKPERVETAEQA